MKVHIYMRCEVFTAVRMVMFRILAPCVLVDRCQRFAETYYPLIQDFSPKYGVLDRIHRGTIHMLVCVCVCVCLCVHIQKHIINFFVNFNTITV
jgi:hypothetical protein